MTVARTVLGAGITGLACALVAARYGPVVLCDRRPHPGVPVVESVPAAALTLLLELGIFPADLGVRRLVRHRTVAWEQDRPHTDAGPACAHLDRAALHAALWDRAVGHPDVALVGRGAADHGRTGCIDATGRRAVTAVSVCRPPRTWTAATVTLPAGAEDDGLHLAAAPDGYAYRLGSTRWTTLGWVGPGSPPRDAGELRRRIASSPGEWLLADVAAIESDRPTLRRPAGLAIPARPAGALAIGDAALSRDALASQGLSLGLADAWQVADPATGAADLAARHADGLDRHLRHLAESVRRCRFAAEPAWAEYGDWLTGAAERAS